MRFILDESADFQLAAYLKQHGHDVTSIVEDYSRSIEDFEVLSIAVQEQRILITNDKAFGELVVRYRLPHHGLILLRLSDESLANKIRWLKHVIDERADELNRYIVITDRGVRVRV